ncbi:MAG: alcohol dehydrogenase catalytic domain-containing protein [Candidatus Bathyarchaeia archaeon]
MRAAVLVGPEKVEVQDRDTPKIGSNELLLKVKAVGVCGSDIAYYKRGMADVPPPIVLGHEFTAEIVRSEKYLKG